MIKFNELKLCHKKIFDGKIKIFRPDASEINFTNLYMWRGHYGLKWARVDDFLWLKIKGENRFFPPAGDYSKKTKLKNSFKEIKKYTGGEIIIERAERKTVCDLGEIFSKGLKISAQREYYDYVYSRDDLAFLKGRNYHKKRNHIKNFLRNTQNPVYEEINENNTAECVNLQKEWLKANAQKLDGSAKEETNAITDVLNNLKKLKCKGAVIRINGKVEAFTVAEKINEDTAVIHIEKANTVYNGLYAYINQKFCETELADAEFVNREQDIGLPNLKKAKKSYRPIRMITKFKIIVP